MKNGRAVLICNERVHEVIEIGPSYVPPHGSKLVFSETANIGDRHDGVSFLEAEDAPQSKKVLAAYVRQKQRIVAKAGIDFDMADPGDDPNIIRVKTDYIMAGYVAALVWVAEIDKEDVTLVLQDEVVKMSPATIIRLNDAIKRHVAHSHKIAGQLIEHIKTAHIGRRSEIDAPEKATAVKMDAWHRHGNR